MSQDFGAAYYLARLAYMQSNELQREEIKEFLVRTKLSDSDAIKLKTEEYLICGLSPNDLYTIQAEHRQPKEGVFESQEQKDSRELDIALNTHLEQLSKIKKMP